MPLPNHPTTDHPGSQFGPTLNELLAYALEKVESLTITQRGRDAKEAILGVEHLLERPADCNICHYVGIDGCWVILRPPDGVCSIHGVPLRAVETRYGLEGTCRLCGDDLGEIERDLLGEAKE